MPLFLRILVWFDGGVVLTVMLFCSLYCVGSVLLMSVQLL